MFFTVFECFERRDLSAPQKFSTPLSLKFFDPPVIFVKKFASTWGF
jgi:hypothetical protein